MPSHANSSHSRGPGASWKRLASAGGRWFLSAPPSRATFEALVLFVGMLGIVILGLASLPRYMVGQSTLFLGPFALFVAAIRLKLPQGNWWRQLRFELSMVPLLVIISGGSVLFSVLAQRGGSDTITYVGLLAAGGAAFLALFSFGYVCLRIGARLWAWWDRLRRRHLLWSLTHAHLTVVILVAMPFVLLLVVNALRRGSPAIPFDNLLSLALVRLFQNIIPILAISAVVVGTAIAAILPLSALVSFIIARQTTQRLETLASATAALRHGDLAARVSVMGEDEVAQLQQDFNGMAADLESAMGELEGERDRVARLLDDRRRLVASASHELRTPIATLRAYLDSARDRHASAIPAGLQQDLDVMEREVTRLQRLVDDLFALSRAEAGRLTLQRAATDMGAVIRHCVTTTAAAAWQAGRVQVVASVPDDLPPVLTDAGRMEQVLLNLLHNAIRHTPPGGIVAVLATREGDTVQIDVRDTGSGIAPSDLPHIWEPFYRGESASGTQGTGLGLALAKELVEAMNGAITVESTPGEGSRFLVHLKMA